MTTLRETLETRLSEERLQRVFWKQTIHANLNTVPGCEQAAKVATDYVWFVLDEVLGSHLLDGASAQNQDRDPASVPHVDPPRPTPECDGSRYCVATVHVHGCFAERGVQYQDMRGDA